MADLEDKVSVVTGAASGIGRATARRLAEAGMRVVRADVERPALDEAAHEVDRDCCFLGGVVGVFLLF